MGVIRSWSPSSMGQATLKLKKMGYNYLAIGGSFPSRRSKSNQLKSIREHIGFDLGLHILGFAKANEIDQFNDFEITALIRLHL